MHIESQNKLDITHCRLLEFKKKKRLGNEQGPKVGVHVMLDAI